ncbi:kynureninase [Fulvivirga sp. RKSG066]|uniref:kynureninase n=1 Tax=Fulvivirga aurantia TaxID=2529383 RepID=UPI0012BD0FC5|nr:kynureninase [Fulvivirga aurantia]MTI22626.1 kynureninase [Fulvivirga aurantia]
MEFEHSLAFAKKMDQQDPLKAYRDKFYIPEIKGKEALYFTGNSLGLQPKNTKSFIEDELEDWASMGVEGHFQAKKRPWFHYHKFSKQALANIVGAKPLEVVSMNNLTANLHFLMVSFYRPTKKRFKLMIEKGAFPSDQYAVESQIKFHGLDYDEALIEVAPRDGEHTLRTEDIVSTINENADSLALVMLSGVQYYTGQLFDIKEITKAAHEAGAYAGFDLAHAAGNVSLNLHDDDVDFAAWCSYKYLNSGPGGVSGIFVHEKHANNSDIPRLAGWWGHNEEERFQMEKGFEPMPGADGWQLSNVNVLSSAAHLASLEIFEEVGMTALLEKSRLLTGYLYFLLETLNNEGEKIEIITPKEPKNRGCQLSLFMKQNGKKVFEALSNEGVIADWREPNVIRVAPVPLYNTFEDVYRFYQIVEKTIA